MTPHRLRNAAYALIDDGCRSPSRLKCLVDTTGKLSVKLTGPGFSRLHDFDLRGTA
jgi:hypothetical protein